MRKVLAVVAGALAAYSVVLAALELHGGARLARVFLEDPPTVLPFAGVHTALSAALLGACAVVFAACRRTEGAARHLEGPDARFLEVQVGLFAFLAADESFRILPMLAGRLGLPETPCYLALGALEAGMLLGPGRLLAAPARSRWTAAAAAACFGVALGLDDAPAGLPLRECLEELPKVWGGALFLYFAWTRLEEDLDALAFPGIGGAAFRWARGARDVAAWNPPIVTSAASRAPEIHLAASAVPREATPQRNGASVPGPDAPEPDPRSEVLDVSAAPPRKLLSH